MNPLSFECKELDGCCAFDVIYYLNSAGELDGRESELDFRRAILATTSNKENTRNEIKDLKRLGFKEIVRFRRIDGGKTTIRLWYRRPTKTKPKKLIKTTKHINTWEGFL